MASPDLDSVVLRLADNSRDAATWKALFDLTWPYVLALSHRLRKGRLADAEDLAQDTFIRLAKSWHAGGVKAWDGQGILALLAVTAKRLAKDATRHSFRQRRDVRKEVSAAEAPEPQTDDRGLSEVEWADLYDRVSRRLDADQTLILDMRLQGCGMSEIADFLNVSVRTVERNLHEIRDLLKRFLTFDD